MPPPAHAQSGPPGYYSSPTITGGGGTQTGPPPTVPYSTNPGTGYYGATVTGTGLSCGGQIETKWTWTPKIETKWTWTPNSPTAPVPQQVIIKQFSKAAWESKTASGKCDDGLTSPTDPPVSTTNSSTGDTSTSVSGTHYSMAPADAKGNVTVDCTPSASISSSSCGVSYQPTLVSPVIINLGGAIQDSSGNLNILVGQGCTASLSGVPSGNGWSATYQWSVSDSANTFQDWEPTTPAFPNASPPTQANPNASYYVPGSGPLTNPTAHWYWNDSTQTTETVTCTATVTPPAGQGSPFNVTVTQNVKVYVPTRSTNTNTIGDGRVISSTIIATPTPLMKNNLESFGSSWTTAVSMPTTLAFGTGQWCYCQLITPGEYVTSGGAQLETTETKAGDGLDATFPYQNSPQDSGIESADGNIYHSGDSPRLSDLNSAVDSVTLTDTLHTYVMFKPPGNDVKWVSLSESRWDTDFTANQPDSGWNTFSPSESVGPINLVYTFVSENNPPVWTQIVQSGQSVTFVPYN